MRIGRGIRSGLLKEDVKHVTPEEHVGKMMQGSIGADELQH